MPMSFEEIFGIAVIMLGRGILIALFLGLLFFVYKRFLADSPWFTAKDKK
jgi:hypothetical protein